MTRAEEQMVEAKAQRLVWVALKSRAEAEIRFWDKVIESHGRTG